MKLHTIDSQITKLMLVALDFDALEFAENSGGKRIVQTINGFRTLVAYLEGLKSQQETNKELIEEHQSILKTKIDILSTRGDSAIIEYLAR